jgi:Protein of unknown function (DUF1353)
VPFESPDLVVRRVDAETWATVDPLVYRGRWQRFVVPAGFRTDFASVPRVVTWLVPRFGAYTLAAILHDWLVDEGIDSGAVTARQADGLFRRVMREAGVPVVRRWLMWAGVRWGALSDPPRRAGWLLSAPGVVAITVLAAPVVLPPVVAIVPGLVLYGLVEWAVGRFVPPGPQELVLPVGSDGAPGPARRA